MNKKERLEIVSKFADGVLTVGQLISLTGLTRKMISNVLRDHPEIPRRKGGPLRGELNPAWKGGRVIQRCGRVLVPAPENHPYARVYGKKKIGRILEHRLAMEVKIGRYLYPQEVVDHIDGCTLNNDIGNLRLFSNNQEHLRSTISGRRKDISQAGLSNMRTPRSQRQDLEQVSSYHAMWRCGDYRLLQILHAHVLLDKDSPYLLGTHRYLADKQIDFSCDQNLKDSLVSLCLKWELFHKLSRLEHLL